MCDTLCLYSTLDPFWLVFLSCLNLPSRIFEMTSWSLGQCAPWPTHFFNCILDLFATLGAQDVPKEVMLWPVLVSNPPTLPRVLCCTCWAKGASTCQWVILSQWVGILSRKRPASSWSKTCGAHRGTHVTIISTFHQKFYSLL